MSSLVSVNVGLPREVEWQGKVVRTRPLCQFPLLAKYKGTGSTDDAANFTCAAQ